MTKGYVFVILAATMWCNKMQSLSLSVLLFRPVIEIPAEEPLKEGQARFYFRDLVLGIEYCKSLHACHDI